MVLQHNEDRQILTSSLNRLLADRHGIEARNKAAFGPQGYSPELYAELVELGAVGALFGEDVGGYGGDGLDIMMVFEALGRGLSTEPLLGAVMAGTALETSGRADDLARVIDGESVITVAHDEPEQGGAPTRAEVTEGGFRLTGTKAVVPHAEAADLFLVSAEVEGQGRQVFLVPAGTEGMRVTGYATIDGGRSGDIVFDKVLVGAEARLEGDGEALIDRALAAGRLALAAEALGAMDRIREDTVSYLQTRFQFGAPIGKFQALQHRMATVLLEVEQARSAVINAALAFGEAPIARDRAISAAKYTTGRIGTLVAEEAIQMHGGIGMTWELAMPHYAKRLIMLDHRLGDEDWHLKRYIALGRG